jgi:hypothetical protein
MPIAYAVLCLTAANAQTGNQVSGNCSGNTVSGEHNSQTNTCYGPPPPQFFAEDAQLSKSNADGTATWHVLFGVKTTYAVSRLRVCAVAHLPRGIKEFEILGGLPLPNGMYSGVTTSNLYQGTLTDGSPCWRWDTPTGPYTAEIITSDGIAPRLVFTQ